MDQNYIVGVAGPGGYFENISGLFKKIDGYRFSQGMPT